MKRLIRGAILGFGTAAVMGLLGCGENNEARVDSKGVTPPGAATTSDAGLKVKLETPTKNPYNKGAGVGPKNAPVRKAPPATSDSAAPATGK